MVPLYATAKAIPGAAPVANARLATPLRIEGSGSGAALSGSAASPSRARQHRVRIIIKRYHGEGRTLDGKSWTRWSRVKAGALMNDRGGDVVVIGAGLIGL